MTVLALMGSLTDNADEDFMMSFRTLSELATMHVPRCARAQERIIRGDDDQRVSPSTLIEGQVFASNVQLFHLLQKSFLLNDSQK